MAEETETADPNEGKRAPAPETIDQTKSTVTQDQVRAMEEAAPQPSRGEGEKEGKNGGKAENDENLDDHTVEELRSIAHKEGADLSGATVKADIIKAIKKNRKKG